MARRAWRDPSKRRTEKVAAQLRAGEVDDLRVIARAWGTTMSTVLWYLAHDLITRARRMEAEFGFEKAAALLGLEVLLGKRAMEAAREVLRSEMRVTESDLSADAGGESASAAA